MSSRRTVQSSTLEAAFVLVGGEVVVGAASGEGSG